jgi:AAA+ ATPase superfamily predicted ATPase
MMYELVMDASAPLYGRAREIMKIVPLNAFYLQSAMQNRNGEKIVEAFAAWGGIPRYWELALDYASTFEAIKDLVLNPLGVLYREPERLLSDQMRDTRQTASLLSIISQGCHRLSEIAARLEKPATSLTRPLAILAELGLIIREVPFGASLRDSKRTLYTIADPFLRLWLKFVEPNRSLIEAGLIDRVGNTVVKQWPQFVGTVWEQLSRQSVPYLSINGRQWKPASRWWGKAIDGEMMEFDIVSSAFDIDENVLVGEATHSGTAKDIEQILSDLKSNAQRCPALRGKNIYCALWIMKGVKTRKSVFTADDVVRVLK